MYQVTWSEDQPHDKVQFMETWAEVISWMSDNDYRQSWTVSIVFEASKDEHKSFPKDSTPVEMGYYMDNMVKMLPESMDTSEVVATLMNFASAYWSHGEMATGFKHMSELAQNLDTALNTDKDKLH